MMANNCTFICREQYQLIEREGCHDIQKKHEANFERWFRDHIHSCGCNAEYVPKPLFDLACGSKRQVRSYRGCIVNGVRFHTKECARILLVFYVGYILDDKSTLCNGCKLIG
jgi:hypothetical protein